MSLLRLRNTITSKMQAEIPLIRFYQAEDLEGVRWLFARTPPAGRVYVRPQPLSADLEAIEDNYKAFWVAIEPTWDGDALIGMLGVTNLDHPIGISEPDFVDRAKPSLRVHWVQVAPERQRRGIGRRLFQAAIDWARERDYQAFILETSTEQEAAIDFYRELGFQEVGRTTLMTNKEWKLVWFRMPIDR